MSCEQFDFFQSKYNIEKLSNFQRPVFIGDFSLDSDRKFHEDKRNLKFINIDILKKKVSFDLDKSYEKVKKRDYNKTKQEKLDHLLNWILLNKTKAFAQTKNEGFTSLSTDFVCFRGLLTELLCTPYERDGWIIHATKYAGTIYLLGIETPEKMQQRLSQTEMNARMSSWGYKFEQYMTNEDPEEGVDEHEEYCCVMRVCLSSHSFMYGAEVDGADAKLYEKNHSSLKAFIELKTSRELHSQKDINQFYRFRLRKWWAQSHLVGIPHLICGFRQPDGLVRSLKSFNVQEIPSMAKIHWNKNAMLNFLDDFFVWVKSVVKEDNPKFVYELSRSTGASNVKCLPLGTTSGKEFLPQKYVNDVFK